jgi:hypothetical protein
MESIAKETWARFFVAVWASETPLDRSGYSIISQPSIAANPATKVTTTAANATIIAFS